VTSPLEPVLTNVGEVEGSSEVAVISRVIRNAQRLEGDRHPLAHQDVEYVVAHDGDLDKIPASTNGLHGAPLDLLEILALCQQVRAARDLHRCTFHDPDLPRPDQRRLPSIRIAALVCASRPEARECGGGA
jgi:hypothetical protein